MKDFVILVGLPGSGKTTYAQNAYPDYTRLSFDSIRKEMGIMTEGEKRMGTPEQEAMMRDVFQKRLSNAISEGKEIVIDNTNLKRKYRKQLVDMARKNGYNVSIVIVKTMSLKENIHRRAGQISPDVIVRMTEGYEYPQPDEYDTIKTHISE